MIPWPSDFVRPPRGGTGVELFSGGGFDTYTGIISASPSRLSQAGSTIVLVEALAELLSRPLRYSPLTCSNNPLSASSDTFALTCPC